MKKKESEHAVHYTFHSTRNASEMPLDLKYTKPRLCQKYTKNIPPQRLCQEYTKGNIPRINPSRSSTVSTVAALLQLCCSSVAALLQLEK